MADKELEAKAEALLGKGMTRAELENMRVQAQYNSGERGVALRAIELLDEADKKKKEEREDRHFQAMLEQNERHHRDLLGQARIAAVVAVVAALAAVGSAWYARVQTLSARRPPTMQSLPQLGQPQSTRSPVSSGAANGSATDSTTQAEQPTTNQTAHMPR